VPRVSNPHWYGALHANSADNHKGYQAASSIRERHVPAKSETHRPHAGAKNGTRRTSEYLDCGIFQEVIAPATGTYVYRIYAARDRAGGWVGANVNGSTVAWRDVVPAVYTMRFTANAGDVIRVWIYSPAWPG
jgi:hypothetical protein